MFCCSFIYGQAVWAECAELYYARTTWHQQIFESGPQPTVGWICFIAGSWGGGKSIDLALGSSAARLHEQGCLNIKGTASIKMRAIDPSHVKESSFTCSLVIN